MSLVLLVSLLSLGKSLCSLLRNNSVVFLSFILAFLLFSLVYMSNFLSTSNRFSFYPWLTFMFHNQNISVDLQLCIVHFQLNFLFAFILTDTLLLCVAVPLVKTSKQVPMSGRFALQFSFPSLAWCYFHFSLETCRQLCHIFSSMLQFRQSPIVIHTKMIVFQICLTTAVFVEFSLIHYVCTDYS